MALQHASFSGIGEKGYEIQKLNLNPGFISVHLYWVKTKSGAQIH